MREFQQERFFKKLLYSNVTIIIFSMFVLILLRSTVGLYEKRATIIEEKNKKEEELRTEQKKLADALEKKHFLESPRGKEEYLRTTFPVAKEGEGVIIIYDDKKEVVTQVKKEMSLKEKLKHFFSNLFGADPV